MLPKITPATVARLRAERPHAMTEQGGIETMQRLEAENPELAKVIATNVIGIIQDTGNPALATVFGIGCCFIVQLLEAAAMDAEVSELEYMVRGTGSIN